MAVPSYTTDLTDLSTAEVTTGWSDLNVAGGGGGALSIEIDFAIQGNNAITRQVSNNTRGAIYDNGTTVMGANDHYFVWTVSSTPGITNTKTAGGIVAVIGNNSNNWNGYYVNGSDTLPQGGMNNYAIHSSSTPSFQDGTGLSGNPSIFGSYIQTNNASKGDNFAIDVIRYGTGFYITAGDATTPITFSGSAAINDSNANRYGVLTAIPGGFALKGRFVVGQNNTGTPTQAYLRESNTSLAITDTEYSLSDFTQLIFDHPSTDFAFDTVTFTTIGTNNKGKFMVNDASTTGSLVSCTFNDFGNTVLNTNVQVTGSSWIGCNGVIQSGSTIFNSNFIGTTDPSGSIISDDPSLISFCTFEGDGTHHGIEVVTPGTYSFPGNIFSGFVSGSNGGEELLFNPTGGTGNLTINIVEAGSNLNFRNLSSGTVTINAQTQITLTDLKTNTEVRVYTAGTQNEIAFVENSGTSFQFSAPSGGSVDIVIHNLQYVYQKILAYSVPATSATLPISQQFDRNYLNPD